MIFNLNTVVTQYNGLLINYRQMLIKMNRLMYLHYENKIAQRFEDGWLLQEYILSEQIREDWWYDEDKKENKKLSKAMGKSHLF